MIWHMMMTLHLSYLPGHPSRYSGGPVSAARREAVPASRLPLAPGEVVENVVVGGAVATRSLSR